MLTWSAKADLLKLDFKKYLLFFLFSPAFSQAKINCSHNPLSAVVGDCWPFDRCQVIIMLHSGYDQDEVDWDF